MIGDDEIGPLLAQARAAWALDEHELARRAGTSVETLRSAERGDAELSDLAAISAALGGSVDDLLRGRHFWEAPAVAFRSASAQLEVALLRAPVLRLARAAADRDVLALLLDLPGPELEFGVQLGPVALGEDIIGQAEDLAEQVRRALGSGGEPIASVRAAMRRLGVPTFLCRFGIEEVDGLSWRGADGRAHAAANVDARRGALTALRMTLAHELCHVLFDGTRGQPFGLVEHRAEHAEAKEQRANAFAAYLLAPRALVYRFLRHRGVRSADKPTSEHVLALSEHCIMGVEAVAWHLVNCGLWERADVQGHRHLFTREQHGEDDLELRPTPAEELVPIERRGEILQLATLALEGGLISAGRWRELVGVGALDPWRRLLDERQVSRDLEHRSL
ncbi:MAG: ImmA/IrrE family metallo-endopeptidase [Deltaproteobacteria bacterium]|nr:ImmA/IrrE family metallo-endopeptidase [Deltaproteobacteria bacterium]